MRDSSRALCVPSNVQRVQGLPAKGACRHVLAVETSAHGHCPISAAALCQVDLEQRPILHLGNAVRSGLLLLFVQGSPAKKS